MSGSVKKKAVKKKTARQAAASTRSATSRTVKKKTSKKKAASKQRGGKPVNELSIELSQVLSINDARQLYSELGEAISQNHDVVINASQVEMVDTAMMQLLVAFIKKLNANKQKCEWIEPTKEMLSRANTLNVSDQLGLHDPEP